MDEKKPPTAIDAPYEVGYGKPPRDNRFKKGQSGNPKGRKRGTKNKINEKSLASIVMAVANREITVREGDQTRTISMLEANVLSTAMVGAKGNPRSRRDFIHMVSEAEASLRKMVEAEAQKTPQKLIIRWQD